MSKENSFTAAFFPQHSSSSASASVGPSTPYRNNNNQQAVQQQYVPSPPIVTIPGVPSYPSYSHFAGSSDNLAALGTPEGYSSDSDNEQHQQQNAAAAVAPRQQLIAPFTPTRRTHNPYSMTRPVIRTVITASV